MPKHGLTETLLHRSFRLCSNYENFPILQDLPYCKLKVIF